MMIRPPFATAANLAWAPISSFGAAAAAVALTLMLAASFSASAARADNFFAATDRSAHAPTPIATRDGAAARAVARGELAVTIDMARPLRFNDPVGIVIVGNPAVVDFTMTDDRFMILTGRSPGRTNAIVYSRDGELIADFRVVVRDDDAARRVTIRRGAGARESYSCTPRCARVITIDDSAAEQGAAVAAMRAKLDAELGAIGAQSGGSETLSATPAAAAAGATPTLPIDAPPTNPPPPPR